jgi:holliday junction DNA helicase RuvA
MAAAAPTPAWYLLQSLARVAINRVGSLCFVQEHPVRTFAFVIVALSLVHVPRIIAFMLNAIKGILVDRSFDCIHIDTHGIEWDIMVPATMIDDFGKVGSETRALVFLQHREDSMKLFGFPNEECRLRFLELIKVEGIGPKQAVRIMSGIRVEALDASIEQDDLAALERVPGIGKKTAQKILLALKGKIVKGPDVSGNDVFIDVVRALIDMGFDRKDVEKAVKSAASGLGAAASDERELFRVALLSLSGGA